MERILEELWRKGHGQNILCAIFFSFIKIILAGTKWENVELWDPLSFPVICSFNLGTEKLSSAMVQALDSRIYKELCLRWQHELEKWQYNMLWVKKQTNLKNASFLPRIHLPKPALKQSWETGYRLAHLSVNLTALISGCVFVGVSREDTNKNALFSRCGLLLQWAEVWDRIKRDRRGQWAFPLVNPGPHLPPLHVRVLYFQPVDQRAAYVCQAWSLGCRCTSTSLVF